LKKIAKKLKVSQYPLIVAPIGGLIIGWIAVFYPQTLFWSEKQMPTILTSGVTPLPYFNATKSIFDIIVPYSPTNLIIIAICKAWTVLILVGCGWPGGIIFPLYFIGAALGNAMNVWFPQFPITLIMLCLMGAVETAVLRTPWSSVLILFLEHMVVDGQNSYARASIPIVAMSCFVSLFLTIKIRFYGRAVQHSRKDLTPVREFRGVKEVPFEKSEFDPLIKPTNTTDEDTTLGIYLSMP